MPFFILKTLLICTFLLTWAVLGLASISLIWRNKHKKDLKDLKYAVKKYCGNKYKEVFCGTKNNKIDKKQSDSEKNENKRINEE